MTRLPGVVAACLFLLSACSGKDVTGPGSKQPRTNPVIAKVSGDNSVCAPGIQNCAFLARVTDTLGAPVAGASVLWSANGSSGITTATNAQGYASAPNLTSSTGGPFTQTAAVTSSSSTVSFTFRTAAVTAGDFNIDIRFTSPVTLAQQAAFTAAANRWSSIIVGDIPDYIVVPADSVKPNVCGITHPAITNERIDDIVVFVELREFDGPNGLLGQAGPCFERNSSNLPIIGVMQFDVADVNELLARNQLQDVITHEMGHVLGFGGWSSGSGLFTDRGNGLDVFFTGTSARDYFMRIGGVIASGSGVPLEDCVGFTPDQCGDGTRASHWRESVFQNELMTGYINSNSKPIQNPLSNLTIASMRDLGYTVNNAAADAYIVPGAAAGNFAISADGAGSSLAEMAKSYHVNEGRLPAPRRLGH